MPKKPVRRKKSKRPARDRQEFPREGSLTWQVRALSSKVASLEAMVFRMAGFWIDDSTKSFHRLTCKGEPCTCVKKKNKA